MLEAEPCFHTLHADADVDASVAHRHLVLPKKAFSEWSFELHLFLRSWSRMHPMCTTQIHLVRAEGFSLPLALRHRSKTQLLQQLGPQGQRDPSRLRCVLPDPTCCPALTHPHSLFAKSPSSPRLCLGCSTQSTCRGHGLIRDLMQ